MRGEGGIAYHYNNGVLAYSDPKLAALNFLNALQTQPQKLLEKYQAENEKISVDIPVLKEVVNGAWRKEPELAALRSELVELDRKIQLSLKSVGQIEAEENREQRGKRVVKGYGTADNVGADGFSIPRVEPAIVVAGHNNFSEPSSGTASAPAGQRHDPAGGQTYSSPAAPTPDGQGVSLPPELQRIREAIKGKGFVARPLHGVPEKKGGFKI